MTISCYGLWTYERGENNLEPSQIVFCAGIPVV